MFVSTVAVFLTEVIKCVICIFLVAQEEGGFMRWEVVLYLRVQLIGSLFRVGQTLGLPRVRELTVAFGCFTLSLTFIFLVLFSRHSYNTD